MTPEQQQELAQMQRSMRRWLYISLGISSLCWAGMMLAGKPWMASWMASVTGFTLRSLLIQRGV